MQPLHFPPFIRDIRDNAGLARVRAAFCIRDGRNLSRRRKLGFGRVWSGLSRMSRIRDPITAPSVLEPLGVVSLEFPAIGETQVTRPDVEGLEQGSEPAGMER